MEDELLRSARLAAVGRLSAGLAHEIRNPLASIQGSAEVLADDFPAGHPKAGLFPVILLQETGRLNLVLTRFLAFAQTEPGDRRPSICRGVRRSSTCSGAAEAPAVVCETSGAGPYCPAFGNREQVRQVLLNLGLNAVAAAGPSGRSPWLPVRSDGAPLCPGLHTGPGFTATPSTTSARLSISTRRRDRTGTGHEPAPGRGHRGEPSTSTGVLQEAPAVLARLPPKPGEGPEDE